MIMAWIGLAMGMAAVVGGAVLEGLHLSSITVPTAAIIVFGGTIGATLLASSPTDFSAALRGLKTVFLSGGHDSHKIVKEILDLANLARKEGILSLEKAVANTKDPFLASNLRKVVDGYDPHILKEMMEERIFKHEEAMGAAGKVWETAGGFAPTVGIIGAVLGLIHVMGNLSDSSKLGSGIAVAFVATVYGVAGANLVFIPIGNRLKKAGKEQCHEMELIMVGITSIQAGLNPRVIEDKMNNALGSHGGAEKKAA